MFKYVSVDIETTGLNPETCVILQVAAIIDNGDPIEKLKRFDFKIRREVVVGEPGGMAMNKELLEELAMGLGNGSEKDMVVSFIDFLESNGIHRRYHNIAGKNFSFDKAFLKKIDGWPHGRARIIDPGNLWLRVDDDAIPSTIECCHRAGVTLDNNRVHDALYDCEIVVKLVRAWGENSA